MAAPAGDVGLVSGAEIGRYVTKIRPLLTLWNESFDPRTLAAYWIVAPRLFAIVRHADQMEVPAGLRLTHRTLLNALACAVQGYLELVAGGSDTAIARASSAAASGMKAFQEELTRQVAAAGGTDGAA